MGVGRCRCEMCVAWGGVCVGRECANLFPGTICRTKCEVRCRKLGGVAARYGSSHSSKGGLRRERSATTSGLYLRSRAWARVRAGGRVGAGLGQTRDRIGAGVDWVARVRGTCGERGKWVVCGSCVGRVWGVCGAGVGRVSGWVWGALPRIEMHKQAVIHPALPIKKDCCCARQWKRSGRVWAWGMWAVGVGGSKGVGEGWARGGEGWRRVGEGGGGWEGGGRVWVDCMR